MSEDGSSGCSLVSPAAPTWKHILFFVLLSVLLFVVPVGLWDLRGPDEGRYVQIAKEILKNNDWLHLTVLGKPYDQKPPLAFWFVALMLKLANGEVVSGLVRQPSAWAGIWTLILTYLIGRRHFGAQAAFVGALVTLSTPIFLDDAPTVELNMMYTFFIVLALWAWMNRPVANSLPWPRLLAFWAGVVGAFFVKGPLAFFIIASALLWAAYAHKSWRELKSLRAWAGIPLVALLIAGWMYVEKSVYGEDFVENQVAGETVNRLLHGDHAEPFYYYFLRIPISIYPVYSLFLLAAVIVLWKQRGRISPALSTLVGWTAFPFFLLCVASGKRQSYLLPLVPAASLIVSWFVVEYLVKRDRLVPKWLQWVPGAFAAVLVVSLIGLSLLSVVRPGLFANYQMEAWYYPVWIAGAVAAAAIAFFWFRRGNRRWDFAIYSLAGVMIVGAFADLVTVRRLLDPEKATRPAAMAITRLLNERNEDTVLAADELARPEFHVYGDYRVLEVLPRDFDVEGTTVPGVLVLPVPHPRHRKATKAHTFHNPVLRQQELERGGFDLVHQLEVSKEHIQLYARTPAAK